MTHTPYVRCEVAPGLRPSERTVAVKNFQGRRVHLRVENDFLKVVDGTSYLPVGIVYTDPETKAVLIELPHEADSGINRLWVKPEDVLEASGVPT
jgi:hypothetical protein